MVMSLLMLGYCHLLTGILGLLGSTVHIFSISGCCPSPMFIALLNARYFIFFGFYWNSEWGQSTSYYYQVQQADTVNYTQGVTHASQASIPDFLYFWYD